jgi:selenocysteine lyase/cysteine desulfurase
VQTFNPLVRCNIPYDYAIAMRARWHPQIPHGTFVEAHRARKAEWLAENMSNPLREWDGRAHISRSRFAKATAQYKATRRAIMAALSADDGEPAGLRLAQIECCSA